MGQFENMIEQCNQLKEQIKQLESKPVSRLDKSVHQIQLDFLKNELSKLGQRLNRANIYRSNDDDG